MTFELIDAGRQGSDGGATYTVNNIEMVFGADTTEYAMDTSGLGGNGDKSYCSFRYNASNFYFGCSIDGGGKAYVSYSKMTAVFHN